MKRTLLATSILALLLIFPALAQPPFGGGPGAPGRPGGAAGPGGEPGPGGPPGDAGFGPGHGRALAAFLELTDEQIDAATALREAAHQQAEPLRTELADLGGQLRDLLAADPADPTAIGETTLAIHAVRGQLRAIAEGLEADFVALLTPEQVARYEAFRAALRALRGPHPGGPGGPGGPEEPAP